jgi:hypothetical protein
MQYHHTQIGTLIITLLGVVIALILIGYAISGILPSILGSVVGLLVVLLMLFMSLTVEVKDRNLICFFGLGLIRRTIPLSDILEVHSVHNSRVSGWGIHWSIAGYWLWNVSGNDAVELRLKGGSTFRIGTDEPDSLVHAIHVNKTAAT